MSKNKTSGLTGSRKNNATVPDLKKMAREVRSLRRELATECREMLQTIDLVAETLEGK